MAKDTLKYIRSMILKAEIHLKIAQMAKSFTDYKKEQLHNVKRKALIKKINEGINYHHVRHLQGKY